MGVCRGVFIGVIRGVFMGVIRGVLWECAGVYL